MLLLVDGYNITKADPATADLSLEEQRESLVTRLRVRGADLLGRGRIVVVFDAASGIGDPVTHSGPVEVRFARPGSADDAIARLARETAEKVVLVSCDNALAERVRVHAHGGCEVRPREVLFEGASPRQRSRKRRYPASSAGIPAGGNSITQELKKLWLTDEE